MLFVVETGWSTKRTRASSGGRRTSRSLIDGVPQRVRSTLICVPLYDLWAVPFLPTDGPDGHRCGRRDEFEEMSDSCDTR